MTRTSSKSLSNPSAITVDDKPFIAFDFDRTAVETPKLNKVTFAAVKHSFGPVVHDAVLRVHDQKEFDIFSFLHTRYELDMEIIRHRLDDYFHREFKAHPGLTFLRPGTRQLIDWLRHNGKADTGIITTGGYANQSHKVDLELSDVPRLILPGNKGVHISSQLRHHGSFVFHDKRYPRVAVIDDKGENLTPFGEDMENVLLLHFVTPDGRDQAICRQSNIIRVSSMEEVAQHISGFISKL